MASQWGAIAGAIGSLVSMFGGGANSAMLSLEASKELQEHQYNLNRKTRQTAYQDTRQSLENAGYNPLLAVGQQAQGGTFGASLNVQDPKAEQLANRLQTLQTLSQTHINSAQANLANKNAFSTVINALNNTKNTNAQVAQMNAQTIGQQIQNNIQNATGMQTAQATLNNIKANTTNTQAQTALNKAQTTVAQNTAKMVTQQANLLGQQATFQNYQNQSAQAQANWFKQHPQAAQNMQTWNNVVSPIVSTFTGGASAGAQVLNAVKNRQNSKK